MNKITIFNKILLSVMPLIFGLLFCNIANAGTASFSLDQSLNEKDGILEVSLNISSNSRINAGQSTINFNNKDLEVISIDSEDSAFDIWMRSPRYSNSKGYIYFAGGTTNAFAGKEKILTIKFKIKNKEIKKANLEFNKNLILAANGRGTNLY